MDLGWLGKVVDLTSWFGLTVWPGSVLHDIDQTSQILRALSSSGRKLSRHVKHSNCSDDQYTTISV